MFLPDKTENPENSGEQFCFSELRLQIAMH
jgi:hypothetical protein